jgi:ferredoxin, 2Fe-2S
MATVRVVPSGIEFEAEKSESILGAAWRNRIYWPTTCNGEATCSVCVFTVLDGHENLSPLEELEEDGLSVVLATLPGDPASHRLACQAHATADIVVRKMGVRKEKS